MVVDAIVLAGGEGWRLKPQTWVSKPLLKINEDTLIDRQVSWLYSNGFENIVVASERDGLTKYDVTYSLEERKLGTGGATKKAFKKISEDRAYVMNVDDIVFYDPNELFDYANKGAGVLLAKPTLPFGRVTLQNGVNVIRFEQNPTLNFNVSVGHYVFKRRVVETFFPDEGDLEFTTMQRLADNGILQGYIYHGVWFTLSTMKDLIRICDFFKPNVKGTTQ